jgi:NAD-dependent dihydropyrimidine dehydrogenase PreA subunit
MSYVIAESCVDVHDRACVDECPVDRIYDGVRKGYIHPDECVDCGAREAVCPVTAIFDDAESPPAGRATATSSASSSAPASRRSGRPGEPPASARSASTTPTSPNFPPPTPRPKAPGLRTRPKAPGLRHQA